MACSAKYSEIIWIVVALVAVDVMDMKQTADIAKVDLGLGKCS